MKFFLKASFFSLLLFQASTSYSQMLELEALEEIKALQAVEEGIDPIDAEIEEQDDDGRLLDDLLYEEDPDIDFGYKGRTDFLAEPKSKVINKPLKHFGYDFFNQSKTFIPRNDIPIPSDYIVGPGDNVELLLYGKKNKRYTLEVTREGVIFIPQIGPIAVSGLNFSELKKTISAIVINQMVGTEVSITLSELGSINLFILGEARKPGMYTVNSLSTLTNAIFKSGGISTSGSLRNIQLKRDGKIILVFDFYDLLLKGDISKDVRLMPNDVIFIPSISKSVGINGEVERPGIYELKDTESIRDIINFAGSFSSKADLKSIEIERISYSNDGFSLINVDLTEDNKDVSLQKGDLIKIYPVKDRMRKVILINGHAQQTGFFSWNEGLKLNEVIRSEQDLLPMTDPNYILVKRIKADQTFEILQLQSEQIFSASPDQAFLLEDMDEITFFPRLLNVDLIETRLLEESYEEDERFLGLTYLKKSIEERREQEEEVDEEMVLDVDTIGEEEDKEVGNKYFEYNVYDYCKLPEEMISMIVDGENEAGDEISNSELDILITDYCRRSLLDPIIAIVEKQSAPLEGVSSFEIYGDVFFPGKYPTAVNNQSLKEAIYAAGGLTKSSYLEEVEITSKNYSGKELLSNTREVSFSNPERIIIKNMDVLNVKTLADFINFVEIKGEVFFPGVYPFRDGENIIDLITRAGGLKSSASLSDAVFQRTEIAENKKDRLKQIQRELRRSVLLMQSDKSIGTGGDETGIAAITEMLEEDFIDEQTVGLLGRLIIDLPEMIEDPSLAIILEDGDSLFVPKKRNTISVIGEVFGENTHQYDESLSVEDYINLSGGVTEFADLSKSYVIKSNGAIMSLSSGSSGFFRTSSSELMPGDSIVVPVRVDQFSSIQAASEVSQIIYQMAVAAAAISSFGN